MLIWFFRVRNREKQKRCVWGFPRSRSWPAAYRLTRVNPPWSLWPVWTRAPPCRTGRPAAVLFLPEAHHCTPASGFLPRRLCCSGSGNSATSEQRVVQGLQRYVGLPNHRGTSKGHSSCFVGSLFDPRRDICPAPGLGWRPTPDLGFTVGIQLLWLQTSIPVPTCLLMSFHSYTF